MDILCERRVSGFFSWYASSPVFILLFFLRASLRDFAAETWLTGNGEQYNFSYNALNQLVQTRDGGKRQRAKGKGSCLSPFAFSYVYDHDGIRVGKTINGTDVTTYIVDKNRPYAQVPSTSLRTGLEEQWSNDSTHPTPSLDGTIGYVYGENLLSRTITHPTPSQEGTFYYHYDGMGSTRTLTDATGVVTDTYSGACPEPVEGMHTEYYLTTPAV